MKFHGCMLTVFFKQINQLFRQFLSLAMFGQQSAVGVFQSFVQPPAFKNFAKMFSDRGNHVLFFRHKIRRNAFVFNITDFQSAHSFSVIADYGFQSLSGSYEIFCTELRSFVGYQPGAGCFRVLYCRRNQTDNAAENSIP